jgi:hypothetical protein
MLIYEKRYVVRNFVHGDEAAIIKLFNEVYKKYGGFIPRTVDYWRWCCLERPDVEENGIFLVFDRKYGKLEGYAVVGTSGNIWEFCCRSSPNTEVVASVLLEKAIMYLKKVGASHVNINVPCNSFLSRVYEKLGFSKASPPKMFVGLLSLREFISALVDYKKMELTKKFDEDIAVKVKNAPSWIENEFSIKIRDEEIMVLDILLPSPTISAQIEFTTLCLILFGIMHPYRALLSLKVKVNPFWKVSTMMKFLSSIRVNDSWFYPLGDYG